VVSVASWFGHDAGGFRMVASKTVCDGVVSVHRGAGQGWRRVGGSMPCRHACCARLEGACVHGNMLHALRALGGTVVPEWHGWGTVYGGSEVVVPHGIGRGCTGELDGEVTGREVVGASLPKSGIHGGHGGVLGRAWGRSSGHWEMGSSSPARLDGAHPLGVSRGGGDGGKERRGDWQETMASGSSSPSSPTV
jgi:hypothetical protein